MPRAIIFDLDGTLVDTRVASWELFSETNEAFGLGVDSREAFFRAFEGNFFETLSSLCPEPKRAEAAKQHFMALLRTRYRPALIPGMADVVRALAPHATLAVVSSNSVEAIRHILVDGGIATCFSHVFSGDVEPKKSVSIRRFLGDQRYATQRRCVPDYHDDPRAPEAMTSNDVVLVTDTVGDIVEATGAGIRAIGVAWGMHTEQQLMEAGAEKVALWPQELVAWLLPTDVEMARCACATNESGDNSSHCCVSQSDPPAAGRTRHGLVSDAGRMRRQQQLRLRTTQSDMHANTRLAPNSAIVQQRATEQSELLQALKRIVGDRP